MHARNRKLRIVVAAISAAVVFIVVALIFYPYGRFTYWVMKQPSAVLHAAYSDKLDCIVAILEDGTISLIRSEGIVLKSISTQLQPITSATIADNIVYAATASGLYQITINDNLSESHKKINDSVYTSVLCDSRGRHLLANYANHIVIYSLPSMQVLHQEEEKNYRRYPAWSFSPLGKKCCFVNGSKSWLTVYDFEKNTPTMQRNLKGTSGMKILSLPDGDNSPIVMNDLRNGIYYVSNDGSLDVSSDRIHGIVIRQMQPHCGVTGSSVFGDNMELMCIGYEGGDVAVVDGEFRKALYHDSIFTGNVIGCRMANSKAVVLWCQDIGINDAPGHAAIAYLRAR